MSAQEKERVVQELVFPLQQWFSAAGHAIRNGGKGHVPLDLLAEARTFEHFGFHPFVTMHGYGIRHTAENGFDPEGAYLSGVAIGLFPTCHSLGYDALQKEFTSSSPDIATQYAVWYLGVELRDLPKPAEDRQG